MEKNIASDASMAPTKIERPRWNKYAFACTMLASMASILLGHDFSVMSGAALFIKDDLKLSDTKIEILMGILNFYSVVGSTLAGRTSDWIGRRYTLIFAAVIFFVGALVMGLAPNYAVLMFGRFVAGVGVGYALMIAPVYTAEVAPASCRGFLTSFPEVFINVGLLIGYISNFAFAKLPEHISWRLMLGAGAVPPIFLAVGALAMPESPRWLVMQGRLGEARRVLAKTSDSEKESEIRLSEIKEAAGIPEHCTDDVVQVSKRNHGEGVWKELLIRPKPSVRRILIAAVGIHFLQQASGINIVALYSPRIFEKAGIKTRNGLLGATVAVGFTKTIFILVATFLLDKIGRRPLLLSSLIGMIISLLGLGFGLTMINQYPEKKLIWAIGLSIATVLSFVASFSIGLGPLAWVYGPEILPLKLRAQGMSLAVAANCIMSGVTTMTFLSLSKAITIGRTFFLFAGVAMLSWIFFYTFLPETRGRTLEEMESLFVKPKDKKERDNPHVELGNGRGTINGHDQP
ncbi:polyol transporter 5-like [Magnolia sinica]|uniref:polyol transporter 5-like n=1 Tax=Magnolia sinica TaxID=86752 RepID=UPI002658F5DE|nr:polyol transporter 5-like [Magnolia sinica]